MDVQEELHVGQFYKLVDGHNLQEHLIGRRRVFRYEGRAPSPDRPAGNFLDLDSQKMHSFYLDDVVPAAAPTAKGRKKRYDGRGKVKRKRRRR